MLRTWFARADISLRFPSLWLSRFGLFLLLGIVCLPMALSGCGSIRSSRADGPGEASSAGSEQERIKVATTTSVFADFIREVGGGQIEVRSVVPAGRDPHTFQPTPQDVRLISESKIVFVNGLGLEGALENVARVAVKPGTRFVTLSEGIDPIVMQQQEDEGDTDAEDHVSGNPHLWLDARLAQEYVRRIERELSEADPSNRANYEKNAASYLAELAELDGWIEEQVATIPEGNRKLVTFHDAFPYFARRYGLRSVGVVMRSPEGEPSAREIAELVTAIRREQVRTVFAEPQLNSRLLEIVAREAGVNVGTMYSDSTDSSVATYTALMRFNTEQVVTGLR